MSSPKDTAMPDGQSPINQPFTVAENISQLIAIDKSIVELMGHTVTALDALTVPTTATNPASSSEVTSPSIDPEAKKEAFRSASDKFLATLHQIDTRNKRQILALEEAGIINLSNPQRQDPNAPTKPSLKPNGVGAIGNLDVGWLNSRSTRVERDMEEEIWGKAADLLKKEKDNLRMGPK